MIQTLDLPMYTNIPSLKKYNFTPTIFSIYYNLNTDL